MTWRRIWICPVSNRRRPAVWLLALCALALALGSAEARPRRSRRKAPPKPPPTALLPNGSPITAESAILVEVETGTILWRFNERQRRPMASTTKIMTASVLMEVTGLNEEVLITEYARKTPYGNLNAKPGEKLPMLDLLYAILLRSSNDGCVAAAQHVDGQAWKFVARMNRRAQELGLGDTHFVTTNGLHNKKHFSTAYDMAQMTRHASRIPLFNEIVATRERLIQRSLNQKDVLVKNHNKLLEQYPGADGVKTGYVRASGKCLVASASRLEEGKPWRLVAVVLKSKDTYTDCINLLDYGFTSFRPVFAPPPGDQNSAMPGTQSALVAAIDPRAGKGILALALMSPLPAGLAVRGSYAAEPGLVASLPFELHSKGWHWPLLVLLGVLLGPRYARTLAKDTRRRRRRLSSRR